MAMASRVDAKLLKQTKFPPEFGKKVDMKKVNIEVMKKWVLTVTTIALGITRWIAGQISEILGNDDDVVIELCFNLLEGDRYPDIKALQINLTGFLDKETPKFCKKLWELCLSAQENPQGVPKELLEAKKLELRQEKLDAERAARAREEERQREQEMNATRARERMARESRPRVRSRSPPPPDSRWRGGRRGGDTYYPSGRGRASYGRRGAGRWTAGRGRSYSRSPSRSRSRSRSASFSRSRSRSRSLSASLWLRSAAARAPRTEICVAVDLAISLTVPVTVTVTVHFISHESLPVSVPANASFSARQAFLTSSQQVPGLGQRVQTRQVLVPHTQPIRLPCSSLPSHTGPLQTPLPSTRASLASTVTHTFAVKIEIKVEINAKVTVASVTTSR
ncbi:Serine/arginine repetitive matrix protein 1 [Ascosphaera acerosa]|nr:Serine/arginine repetitive matrix protein 1 [Ascosphaera acerosa]